MFGQHKTFFPTVDKQGRYFLSSQKAVHDVKLIDQE